MDLSRGVTFKKDSTFEVHMQEATLMQNADRISWNQFRKNLGLLQFLLLDQEREDED